MYVVNLFIPYDPQLSTASRVCGTNEDADGRKAFIDSGP